MNAATSVVTAIRQPARHLRALALILAFVIGGAGIGAFAPEAFGQSESTTVMPGSCPVESQEVGAEAFARTELFFGTAKPDGTAVTDAEWRGFLDGEITERFPDGLTVLTGLGQWQESDDDIVQERSMLVILLYPREFAAESSDKIEEIRTAYEDAFQQESVLRSDDSLPVCTSF